MTISDQKAAQRQRALAQRESAFRQGYDFDANARLMDEIGAVTDMVISGYMPMRTELSPLATMTKLSAGNQICAPVIMAKATPLQFREWTPDCAMEAGTYGAPIPSAGEWRVPQIMIVPLLAFDAKCNRMGYGGGFYDRTIATLRAKGDLRTIGFAFDAQEIENVLTEPTDQMLDIIITESRTLRPLAD